MFAEKAWEAASAGIWSPGVGNPAPPRIELTQPEATALAKELIPQDHGEKDADRLGFFLAGMLSGPLLIAVSHSMGNRGVTSMVKAPILTEVKTRDRKSFMWDQQTGRLVAPGIPVVDEAGPSP